ncbi:MAG: hypothetical protein ABSB42_10290 [Tepidisphaeraceae bacterium]
MDPFQPDQRLQAPRDQSAALPDAIANEPAGNADQPLARLVAGPVEVAKSCAGRVNLSLTEAKWILSIWVAEVRLHHPTVFPEAAEIIQRVSTKT